MYFNKLYNIFLKRKTKYLIHKHIGCFFVKGVPLMSPLKLIISLKKAALN